MIQVIPLMAGPMMQFVEFFPFLRNFDFLFGNQLKKLRHFMVEINAIVANVSCTPAIRDDSYVYII